MVVGAHAALLLFGDPSGSSRGQIKQVCKLDPEDFHRYTDAYQVLKRVFFDNSFAYFKGSARAFLSVWKEANNAFAAGEISPVLDPDGLALWAAQLRSAALSLCLSLCYHQEQMYQEICKKHGTDSNAHRAAKVLFGELHDTYQAYRFMYALRNVMIHDAMDAITLQGTAELDEDGEPIAMWLIQLDRSFLSQSKKLKPERREEFASLTENPGLPELFAELADPMSDANEKLLGILHSDLTEVCRAVIDFDDLFGDSVGLRAIGELKSPTAGDDLNIGLATWSSEVITFARRYEPGQIIKR